MTRGGRRSSFLIIGTLIMASFLIERCHCRRPCSLYHPAAAHHRPHHHPVRRRPFFPFLMPFMNPFFFLQRRRRRPHRNRIPPFLSLPPPHRPLFDQQPSSSQWIKLPASVASHSATASHSPFVTNHATHVNAPFMNPFMYDRRLSMLYRRHFRKMLRQIRRRARRRTKRVKKEEHPIHHHHHHHHHHYYVARKDLGFLGDSQGYSYDDWFDRRDGLGQDNGDPQFEAEGVSHNRKHDDTTTSIGGRSEVQVEDGSATMCHESYFLFDHQEPNNIQEPHLQPQLHQEESKLLVYQYTMRVEEEDHEESTLLS